MGVIIERNVRPVPGFRQADAWQVAIEIAARVGGDPGLPGLEGPMQPPAPVKPRTLALLETAGWRIASAEAKAALEKAHKTASFHIYPGAGHGFHADYRPSYKKEAAEDAWKRALAWFKKYKVL